MRHVRLFVSAVFVLSAVGCDRDRIGTLEKQVKDLHEQSAKQRAAADFDLQERCARDSKAWFKENWTRDKDTALLDYTDHYNKSMNKCFILVEFHYSMGTGPSWVNDISLWDVNENSKYGDINVSHYIYSKPEMKNEDSVGGCTMLDKKCKTLDEFNQLASSYMND
jgi:hypothetical protein